MTKWHLRTEKGGLDNPNWSIFPIISHDTPEEPFRVIGTAFMIARPGIFLTARHCLYKDNNNSEVWADSLGVLHHAHRFKWTTYLDESDVAIGQLDFDEEPCQICENHSTWRLCTWSPVEKELICHWGCESSIITVENEDHPEYRHPRDLRAFWSLSANREPVSTFH